MRWLSMDKEKSDFISCTNYFKSETEEEKRYLFNKKWLELINSSAYINFINPTKSDLQKTTENDIINSTVKQVCSANQSKKEWNKL